MGRHGFQINLHPKWKGLVAAGGISQKEVDHVIKDQGNDWLDACGYDKLYHEEGDPDDGEPGKVRRSYEARSSIRVHWGEWGPEHITVPGSACGLDISRHGIGNPLRGPSLVPHNVDSWRQVQLLLIIFTFFAESMTINAWEKIGKGEV